MTPLTSLTLEGRHVRLEPLSPDHAEPLLAAASESRATYGLTFVPEDLAGMRRYIDAALADVARGAALPFATVDRNAGRVVGSTRFGHAEYWTWPGPPAEPLPAGPDAIEIGWTWLAASAQRSALNTEAKLLMLGHAFELWRVRRVTLKTDARNARSRAAIERLGAKFDGVLRANMPAADGGVRDTAFYSILPAEWPVVRAGLLRRIGENVV